MTYDAGHPCCAEYGRMQRRIADLEAQLGARQKHYVIDGLIEPGRRGIVTICPAASVEDALRIARAYYKGQYEPLSGMERT